MSINVHTGARDRAGFEISIGTKFQFPPRVRRVPGRMAGSRAGDMDFIAVPPPQIRPARSSTPSSRFSSSGAAGIMGSRCSLVGISPMRFIMYLMGMGLVSKNTD